MADCLVLDTGALIALERKNRIVASALRVAYDKRYRVLIPAVAYTEWVRGATQGLGKRIEEIAILVGNERAVSRMAGEALRTLELDGREHLADATVAACARHYGGLLLTSDPGDMHRLLAAMSGNAVQVITV